MAPTIRLSIEIAEMRLTVAKALADYGAGLEKRAKSIVAEQLPQLDIDALIREEADAAVKRLIRQEVDNTIRRLTDSSRLRELRVKIAVQKALLEELERDLKQSEFWEKAEGVEI